MFSYHMVVLIVSQTDFRICGSRTSPPWPHYKNKQARTLVFSPITYVLPAPGLVPRSSSVCGPRIPEPVCVIHQISTKDERKLLRAVAFVARYVALSSLRSNVANGPPGATTRRRARYPRRRFGAGSPRLPRSVVHATSLRGPVLRGEIIW